MESKITSGLEKENEKCLLVIKWIKADISERREHLISLMECLNFEKNSLDLGRNMVENEPLCYKSAECLKLLYTSAFSHCKMPQDNAILIFNTEDEMLQAYQPAANISLEYFTTVIWNGFLLVFLYNQEVYRREINIARTNWRLTDLLEDHTSWMRAVVHENSVFVSGDNTMEEYACKHDEWTMVDSKDIVLTGNSLITYWSNVTPILIARENPACCVYDHKIYVAGGSNSTLEDGENLKSVEFYCGKSNSWTRIKDMNIGRSCFGLCAVEGKLYAVGCHEEQCSIERFDFQTEKWEDLVNNSPKEIMAQATISMHLSQ